MGDSNELALVIMAAGKGTRMRSRLPKVLHPVCGRPIVMHAIVLGQDLGAARIVVIAGQGIDPLRDVLRDQDVEIVEQREQLGTAHAALQASDTLKDHDGPVLVMNGDHPLYRAETFVGLMDAFRPSDVDLSILVTELPKPHGYGRVVRGNDGNVQKIVEERDADQATKTIREVSLGAYLSNGPYLFDTLRKIGNDNAQSEYYLTDLIRITAETGGKVVTAAAADWEETLGINDRVELAQAERIMRRRINERWMRDGVSFIDPEQTYIDIDCSIGADTVIQPGALLRRGTQVGEGCRIDAGALIDASQVGDGSWIKPHCWIEDSKIGRACVIGPSAHLRPNVDLGNGCRVGNYVEVKNSKFGDGSKADHLSYIGDSDLGSGVTIGCGAITVNYDGQNKSRTTIGDGAFVGCNSNLIAPVEVEPGAYVAAGSTITKTVPGGALGVGRAQQRNIEGWREKRFKKDGK